MDPLILEALDNHDSQPETGATKAGSGWQESIDMATTRPQWWATTNNESVQRMVMAAMKRARMARAIVTAMRVPVNKEGKGGTGHGIGNEGGMQQRGQWGQWQEPWQWEGRESYGNQGNGNGKGKQQSISDGIHKGGRWLTREYWWGDHMTTMVGNNKCREHAVDDHGSDEEGKGGKGNGDGNEGGGRQRG
jgi:hypothetical protein